MSSSIPQISNLVDLVDLEGGGPRSLILRRHDISWTIVTSPIVTRSSLVHNRNEAHLIHPIPDTERSSPRRRSRLKCERR